MSISNKPILVIDFENCPKLECIDPNSYSKIILFLSKSSSKITIPDSFCNQMVDFSVYKIDTTGKNNLDFHIVHFISDYLARGVSPNGFCLMSKDTGFDGVIKTINLQYGRVCSRIETACLDVVAVSEKSLSTSKSLSKSTEALPKKVNQILIKEIKECFIGKERNKPTNQNKLSSWVSNRYKDLTDSEVKDLVERLVQSGFLNKK